MENDFLDEKISEYIPKEAILFNGVEKEKKFVLRLTEQHNLEQTLENYTTLFEIERIIYEHLNDEYQNNSDFITTKSNKIKGIETSSLILWGQAKEISDFIIGLLIGFGKDQIKEAIKEKLLPKLNGGKVEEEKLSELLKQLADDDEFIEKIKLLK